MGNREKTLAALLRKNDTYIPFEFWLCPSQQRTFETRTGQKSIYEYYNFPIRGNWACYCGSSGRFDSYYDDLSGIRLDKAWGVGYRKGEVEHFTHIESPMKSFETLAQFEAYPYPDPVRDFDWASAVADCAKCKTNDWVVYGGVEATLFEMAWYLRGMETFMMDLLLNPELAHYHLDRITAIRCEMAKRYALAGCDILRLGDDVSTQLAMMMKLDTWREFLKPRLAAVIQAAKSANPAILIFYHGDGNCQAIIPELIEIGVDILNPVQPECMDPIQIKRQYGDKLSLWGTLGTQTTLPFGKPEDVRRMCANMIQEAGRGGGLVLAPTHVIEPEVPWENIEAFMDTVREYNSRA